MLTPNGRVKDWLYGVRAAQPDKEAQNSMTSQPLTEAERYRIIYHMITDPTEEGGAGITPKQGQWKNVESIFPLHDQQFNKEWIRKWSTLTILKAEDLDAIRDHLGEKVRHNSISHEMLLIGIEGRLLLCVYPVVFRFLDAPSWLRTCCVGSAR